MAAEPAEGVTASRTPAARVELDDDAPTEGLRIVTEVGQEGPSFALIGCGDRSKSDTDNCIIGTEQQRLCRFYTSVDRLPRDICPEDVGTIVMNRLAGFTVGEGRAIASSCDKTLQMTGCHSVMPERCETSRPNRQRRR